jgi:glycosyltransferase involved in cell wall biosynthesis
MNTLELSLVIPCHNEEKNLQPLLSAIHAAVDPLGWEYEVLITDDCSTDNSWSVLKELAASDPRLRIQRFGFNCGESAASWAGIQASRGRHIATLDADLQNDPKDLPAMLEALKQADCVCGIRAATRGKGDNWIRIASSHIANSVRNKLSGDNISDAGCTYRVFKRECIAHVKFFNSAPRFLPTLIKMEGFRVVEVPVSTNPRFSGTSHYGVWNRLFKSFRDLLGVRWMKSRQLRYQITESVNAPSRTDVATCGAMTAASGTQSRDLVSRGNRLSATALCLVNGTPKR